jgi:signal transduction histidine kinase
VSEKEETEARTIGDGASADGAPRRAMVDAELLADFGHQVRNQLNAVVGAAGLLATGATSGDERELASIVEIGAEQVSKAARSSSPSIPSTSGRSSRTA